MKLSYLAAMRLSLVFLASLALLAAAAAKKPPNIIFLLSDGASGRSRRDMGRIATDCSTVSLFFSASFKRRSSPTLSISAFCSL